MPDDHLRLSMTPGLYCVGTPDRSRSTEATILGTPTPEGQYTGSSPLWRVPLTPVVHQSRSPLSSPSSPAFLDFLPSPALAGELAGGGASPANALATRPRHPVNPQRALFPAHPNVNRPSSMIVPLGGGPHTIEAPAVPTSTTSYLDEVAPSGKRPRAPDRTAKVPSPLLALHT